MKILVTGGAGYIGSIAVKQLLLKKHEVTILDNLSTGNARLLNRHAKFHNVDLLNLEDVRQIFKDNDFDAVMHFASLSQVSESVRNPQEYFNNNIIGTLNLLTTMLEFRVGKFIFSSSAAIFGEPSLVPVDENCRKNPLNAYGHSKLMIENVLDEYDRAYGLKSVCLRYFNAGGADSDNEFGELHNPETHLIPLILKVANSKDGIAKIFGNNYKTKDGTCIRDYIHVEDLVDAHLLALDFLSSKNKSEKFNLGSETGYSVLEIIAKCKEISGVDFPVEISEPRAGDPAILIASSQKIKLDLGWQARRSLDDIIKSAWEWEKTLN